MSDSPSAALKVLYWTAPLPGNKVEELDGLDEFKSELSKDYVSVVQSRPGERGGGLYELVVEFISAITLQDFATFLLQGIAYDLIKSGSKAFILRPFLDAYEKFKSRNADRRVDIDELKIVFQDTTIILHQISENSIFLQLGDILSHLANHSHHLVVGEAERPFEIVIPVFEDPSDDPPCRFREKLDVDETIPGFSDKDYFGFWGLWYEFAKFRVYDVQNKALLHEEFFTAERYWAAMDERWARERQRRDRDAQ
jgi:hypothetical protein